MRSNLPVTDTEYVLQDDTLIVSQTDLKGRLTYFNDQFVAASGFSDEELMGQPHNIVRHPDMPPEAFANLWDTLKDGKPWAGAVKNRRKNGDYYWVLASATPLYENGSITGYMSIRTKLPADQRSEAERVYDAIRNKRKSGVRIEAGMIRRTSWRDLLAPFTRSVGTRLTVLSGLLALAMTVISAVGLFGMSRLHDHARTIYEEHTAPLQQLVQHPNVTAPGSADTAIASQLAGASAEYDAAGQTYRQGLAVALAVLGLGLLSGLLLARSTIVAIVRPLAHLNEVMARVAQGVFNSRIRVERDDEAGIALRNLQAMQAKLGFDRESQRDMERRAAAQRRADMHRLAGTFENAVGGVIEAVASTSGTLENSAGALADTAEATQSLSISVASASEQASANVQSVASATEEMSSSVVEISRRVQDSARLAVEAVEQARLANDRVARLTEAANRIGTVVDLISGIAARTNLLALNATIEAARAGESGRGFAVVATEVKALADQTSKATGEIGQQIAGMQAATQESVSAIQRIGGTIGTLSEISSAVAAAVEEQGAATREIARNVTEAAHGTGNVSATIADVQRGATDTGSASVQVLEASRALSAESNRLRTEVDRFLATVRTA